MEKSQIKPFFFIISGGDQLLADDRDNPPLPEDYGVRLGAVKDGGHIHPAEDTGESFKLSPPFLMLSANSFFSLIQSLTRLVCTTSARRTTASAMSL